jgi:hypothetical protein
MRHSSLQAQCHLCYCAMYSTQNCPMRRCIANTPQAEAIDTPNAQWSVNAVSPDLLTSNALQAMGPEQHTCTALQSNEWTGKRCFQGRCLHSIGEAPNPYETAISVIGKTLQAFDDDNLIPAYGFGDGECREPLAAASSLCGSGAASALPAPVACLS